MCSQLVNCCPCCCWLRLQQYYFSKALSFYETTWHLRSFAQAHWVLVEPAFFCVGMQRISGACVLLRGTVLLCCHHFNFFSAAEKHDEGQQIDRKGREAPVTPQ